MEKDGVLVVGSANMDLVVVSDRFPKPGETIFGKNFETFAGGKGANQAVSCAKLGCKTYFLGKMGNDEFRLKLSESMISNGVVLDYLLVDKNNHTGIALIVVEGKGENEIIVVSGSNMKLSPADIKNSSEVFSKVNVVLTQLEIPIETVCEAAFLAKQNNALFILNPAPACELPEGLLEKVDIATPNEMELSMLSGKEIHNKEDMIKAAEILLNKGVKNIIVTLGKRGSVLINKELTKSYSTQEVNVVDTTGAGDAFNGALASALARGEELDKAIVFANIAASFSVTRMGAQDSMPTLEEIKEQIEYPQ